MSRHKGTTLSPAQQLAGVRAARRRTLIALSRQITDVVDAVEVRCMAVDGPVTPTLQEMTEVELRRLYRAAKKLAELL